MKRRDFIKQSITLTAGLSASYCGQKSGREKIKVVVLGLDGANWPTIDPLLKKGKLPFLKKLKDQSAWADFKTFKPAKSNVVWNSIASGKTMYKHGIMDFVFLRKNGIKVPYSKSERKEPMIWQILDAYEKRCAVLNWWVSHPPDKINGVMVSDHFRKITSRVNNQFDQFRYSIYPETYFEKFRKMVNVDSFQEILDRTGLPDYINMFLKQNPQGQVNRNNVLLNYRGFVKRDELIERVSKSLFKDEDFDFFATYFRLPDVVQHFITFLMDRNFKDNLKKLWRTNNVPQSVLNEAILMISDLIEPVYSYMEGIIKEFMDSEKGKNTYFIILSDHGFSLYPGGYNHYGLPKSFEAPDGILMINGPQVTAGKIKQAGVFDIAPTILHLFDLPIGKNMDGRVLRDVLKLNRKTRFKEYKLTKDAKLKRDDSYDKESLKELRSIGYISD